MAFIQRITGSDISAKYENLNQRISLLPKEYQLAWEDIFVKISMHSNFSGRNLTPLYIGVVELLEEMNYEGKTIKEIFNDDIDGFCKELTISEPTFDIRVKLANRLNKKIEKKFKLEG